MKRREHSFFSKNKKKAAPAPLAEPRSPEAVRMDCALLFDGAPEPMPLVDDQLFLYMAPQGGLSIGPQCTSAPMLVLWREGMDWLVRRLGQETLLFNGVETQGDSPILLQDGSRMELVGVCAFTFMKICLPAPVLDQDASIPEETPEVTPDPIPATCPGTDEEPVPVAEPEPEVVEVPAEKPDIARELALAEEAPFDWKPCFLEDEPEAVEAPVPEITEEPAPAEEPEMPEAPIPAAEPEMPEEPEVIEGPVPETPEEPVPVVAEAPAFDWKPYDFPEVADIVPDPVHELEPETISEPVPVMVPEETPVPTAEDPLVLAFERLAAGDREALQELPGLLAQKDLYCWGGFNFLGVYLQPIPAVRPADWSGDTDALDQLGWEPRPGMVIPVFTCEEEAVKRECPLGAFPSASAPDLFAHFAETGLDLELDPFGAHPVKISAAAVREISQILGGSPEKFRWIRRTLPW